MGDECMVDWDRGRERRTSWFGLGIGDLAQVATRDICLCTVYLRAAFCIQSLSKNFSMPASVLETECAMMTQKQALPSK